MDKIEDHRERQEELINHMVLEEADQPARGKGSGDHHPAVFQESDPDLGSHLPLAFPRYRCRDLKKDFKTDAGTVLE